MRLIFFCLAATLNAAVTPEKLLPSEAEPFTPPKAEARERLKAVVEAYMSKEPGAFAAHPTAAIFPGAVRSVERLTRSVSYDPALMTRWDTTAGNAPDYGTGPEVWQETALYAAPGEVVTVTAAALPPGRTVEVVIGCHNDSLFDADPADTWRRFPIISRSFELKVGENRIANPFGGLMFIYVHPAEEDKSPPPTSAKYSLIFAHAVAAPTYELGRDTATTWAVARRLPAPWGTLMGKRVILHARTADLAKIDDPKALLEWWDRVLEVEDDLVALERRAPERIVADVQISVGYMHSGYPFMCFLDPSGADMLNLPKLKKEGDWGFFHELGHNHQRQAWTFSNQGEVTCNFFSLLCMEKIVGLPTGKGHEAFDDIEAVLAKRLAQPVCEDPFEELAPFVVLIRAHGWEPLRATLRSYAGAPLEETDEAKLRDLFVLRYGKAAKSDVSSWFFRLGYPVSPATRLELSIYPAFTYTPQVVDKPAR